MIKPIANTSATPDIAITNRFLRHCKSRSAALSMSISSRRDGAPHAPASVTLLNA